MVCAYGNITRPEETMKYYHENTLRELVDLALTMRREYSDDNMADKAIRQQVLLEEFINGKWQITIPPDHTSEHSESHRSHWV
jgi:hypothetical protein